MSDRTVAFLLVIFLVVAGLYFFTAQKGLKGAKSLLTPLGQKAWKEADVIEIYQGEKAKGFKLVRKEGHWRIENDFLKPAKEAQVEELLETLAGLYGEKRASGKKYFSRFKLEETEALHLVLKKGDQELAHLLLGKRGPQWESTFLRFAGQEKIYLVPVNFLAKFDIWEDTPQTPKDTDWIDLKIAQVSPKDLKELSVKSQGQTWRLWREKETWFLAKGGQEKKVPKEKVEKFLRKVFPLLAEKVVPPAEFKKTQGQITYETNLETKGSILLGPCQGKAKGQGKEKAKKKKEEEKEIFCLLRKREFVYQVDQKKLKPLLEAEGL